MFLVAVGSQFIIYTALIAFGPDAQDKRSEVRTLILRVRCLLLVHNLNREIIFADLGPSVKSARHGIVKLTAVGDN